MCEASLTAQMVKNPPAVQETWFDPWIGKIPWRREWLPTPRMMELLCCTPEINTTLYTDYMPK